MATPTKDANPEFVRCHRCGTQVSPLHGTTWRILTDWQTMRKVEVPECEACWDKQNA